MLRFKVETRVHETTAKINDTNNQKGTALHCCASRFGSSYHHYPYGTTLDRIKIIKSLAGAGADCHLTDRHGRAALHIAAYLGSVDIVKSLIEIGASVNQKTTTPDTQSSINYEFWGYCQAEDSEGPKAIQAGQTPLHRASNQPEIHSIRPEEWQRNCPPVIKMLIASRANFDTADLDGMAPLHTAVVNNDATAVQALIDAAVWIDKPDNDGNTPLHIAVERAIAHSELEALPAPKRREQEAIRSIIKALVTKGANLHKENNQKQAPFDRINELFSDDEIKELQSLKPVIPYSRGWPSSYASLFNQCCLRIWELLERNKCANVQHLPLPTNLKEAILPEPFRDVDLLTIGGMNLFDQ